MADRYCRVKVISTLGRLWGTCGNKVIQIMKQIRKAMLMEKDPFSHISYGIEKKWCRTETEGE